MSRRCVVHDCPEDPIAGRCYDWLNDPAVPSEPVCDFGPPQRLRLSRQRGWRLPPGAKSVARPTKWGNPWRVGGHVTAEIAVDRFRADLLAAIEDPWGQSHDIEFRIMAESLDELRGRDLACWCRIGDPCHGDALLAILAVTA